VRRSCSDGLSTWRPDAPGPASYARNTTRVGTRDKDDPGQISARRSQPASYSIATIRERYVEHIRRPINTAPSRIGRWQYEQAPDGARPEPESFASKRSSDDADLLIELAERRLDRGELRLHLHDHHRLQVASRTEHIQRAALAELRIRHFKSHLPSRVGQASADLPDELGMSLVKEPIQIAAAPGHGWLPARIERAKHPPHRLNRELPAMPALDQRDRLLRDVCPLSQLLLRPAPASSQRPQDPTGTHIVHRRRIDRDARL
jgi:hypothetical protein